MTSVQSEVGHAGHQLGLPAEGSGSMARLGRRIGALFMDWFAASIISSALVTGPSPVQSLLTLGVFALEVWLLTWLTGASFGQRIMGIQVRGRTRRLGAVGAALRTLLICLVIPPVIWDSDGRGMHDRAVDSVVVLA